MDKALLILREETEESLAGGDASERINTLNNVRVRKRKLEKHVQNEIRDLLAIIAHLKLREDKSVIDTLNARLRAFTQDLQSKLAMLVEDFEL